MFGLFIWNSSKVCFFENCLAEDFFALGASNRLESADPFFFLNRLADFCLVSYNFGGWWKSRPNGAREIKDTVKIEAKYLYLRTKMNQKLAAQC